VENEKDVLKALDEAQNKGINALVVYLGNFGPEGPLTMLAQKFDGPVMLAAASEETGENLFSDRGDAYCGMLSASYNAGLRNIRPYIPEGPLTMLAQKFDGPVKSLRSFPSDPGHMISWRVMLLSNHYLILALN